MTAVEGVSQKVLTFEDIHSDALNEQTQLIGSGRRYLYRSPDRSWIRHMAHNSHKQLFNEWGGFRYTTQPSTIECLTPPYMGEAWLNSLIDCIRVTTCGGYSGSEVEEFIAKRRPHFPEEWAPRDFISKPMIMRSPYALSANNGRRLTRHWRLDNLTESDSKLTDLWAKIPSDLKEVWLVLGYWALPREKKDGDLEYCTYRAIYSAGTPNTDLQFCNCHQCAVTPEEDPHFEDKGVVMAVRMTRGMTLSRLVANVIRKIGIDGEMASLLREQTAKLIDLWSHDGLELKCTLSWGLGDILRLGDGVYEGGDTCFRDDGEYEAAKHWIALCPNSVVFYIEDENGQFFGRAWGQYVPGKWLALSNMYCRNGLSREYGWELAAKAASELLGSDGRLTVVGTEELTNPGERTQKLLDEYGIAFGRPIPNPEQFGIMSCAFDGYCYCNGDTTVFYTPAGLEDARSLGRGDMADTWAASGEPTNDEVLRDEYDDDDEYYS